MTKRRRAGDCPPHQRLLNELDCRHAFVRAVPRLLRSLHQARRPGECRDAGPVFQHADRRGRVGDSVAPANNSSRNLAGIARHRFVDVETTPATAAEIRHRRLVMGRHLFRDETTAALARFADSRHQSAVHAVRRDPDSRRTPDVAGNRRRAHHARVICRLVVRRPRKRACIFIATNGSGSSSWALCSAR